MDKGIDFFIQYKKIPVSVSRVEDCKLKTLSRINRWSKIPTNRKWL